MDVHGPPDPCLRKRVPRVEGHDVFLRRGLENKHGADHGLPVVGEQRARNDGGYAARGEIALMSLVVRQAKRQGARLVQAVHDKAHVTLLLFRSEEGPDLARSPASWLGMSVPRPTTLEAATSSSRSCRAPRASSLRQIASVDD